MSTQSNALRAISVELTPVRRWLRPAAVRFEVFLDTRPLGRRSRPEWQSCWTISGEIDCVHLGNVLEWIDGTLHRHEIAPDLGLSVCSPRGTACSKRLAALCSGLQTDLSRVVSRHLGEPTGRP